MKIEIGESLAQSWLKHEKGCQVVQLNWKSSGSKDLQEEALALAIYKDAIGQAAEPALFDIGGQPSRDPQKAMHQFLRQAEIDAFGVKLSITGSADKLDAELFAVDVAFHAKGLGYTQNNKKVAMKMVRSALALLTGFGKRSGHIVFASPNVRAGDQEILEATFAHIAALFERHELTYQFDLITNEAFASQLLIPTIEKTRNQTDTAELFLRSVRMLERFPNALAAAQSAASERLKKKPVASTLTALSVAEIWGRVRNKPTTDGELGIGAALHLIMQRLDKEDTSLAKLRQVLDAGTRLGMSSELPIFRPFTTAEEQVSRRYDSRGRSRYYITPLARHKLLFSSEWNYAKHYNEWTRLLNDANLLNN